MKRVTGGIPNVITTSSKVERGRGGLFMPFWAIYALCGLLMIGMLAMGLGYHRALCQASYIGELQCSLIVEKQTNVALITLLLHYSEVDPNFWEKYQVIMEP